MKKNNFWSRVGFAHTGFTLVELMVAISIIALLTGIIVTNLSSSKGKARDGKRISDIAQIQLALERYFDRCGQYPTSLPTTPGELSGVGVGICPTGISLASFISQIPVPPSQTEQTMYDYYVNSSSVATDYILHAKLESGNTALGDSLKDGNKPDWTSTGGTSIDCYVDSSIHPLDYCASPK